MEMKMEPKMMEMMERERETNVRGRVKSPMPCNMFPVTLSVSVDIS